MFEMRQAGKTYEEIGKCFNMTRKGSYWILTHHFPIIRRVKFTIYVNKKCFICGKSYKRPAYQAKGVKSFCSRECFSKSAMSPEEFRKKRRELMKRYYLTEHGNEKVKKLLKKSYTKYKYKALARAKFHKAIKRGKIKKQIICSECLNGERRIEAHHTDYSKPLEVIWLCSVCHANRHKKHVKL